MNSASRTLALVGVALLLATVACAVMAAAPAAADVGGVLLDGVASPIGNDHSGGTAWLHDPPGGSIGLPD